MYVKPKLSLFPSLRIDYIRNKGFRNLSPTGGLPHSVLSGVESHTKNSKYSSKYMY